MTEQEQAPLISIVMPCYNSARFIAESIESAINQTYGNWELIIVDDCGTDNAVDIVKGYQGEDPRIKLFSTGTNSGAAAARNIGIDKAEGEWIALLDSDDLWEPDKLERQISLAIENEAQLVFCSYDLIDEKGTDLEKPFIVPTTTTYDEMLTKNVFGCSAMMVQASWMKENPFSSEYYHEDYLLWMTLLKKGCKAIGDPKILMHYRQISTSRSHNKANAAKHRWIIYRKALGLGRFRSAKAFIGYAFYGVKKYFIR